MVSVVFAEGRSIGIVRLMTDTCAVFIRTHSQMVVSKQGLCRYAGLNQVGSTAAGSRRSTKRTYTRDGAGEGVRAHGDGGSVWVRAGMIFKLGGRAQSALSLPQSPPLLPVYEKGRLGLQDLHSGGGGGAVGRSAGAHSTSASYSLSSLRVVLLVGTLNRTREDVDKQLFMHSAGDRVRPLGAYVVFSS